MPQRNNMGRKSFKTQDGQLDQNLPNIPAEIGRQPTRPSVHRQKPTKSSKPTLRKTK